MQTFLMILFVVQLNAVEVVEFDSIEDCESALVKIEMDVPYLEIYGSCVTTREPFRDRLYAKK